MVSKRKLMCRRSWGRECYPPYVARRTSRDALYPVEWHLSCSTGLSNIFIIVQSQHIAGPAIITVVLQAACYETDPVSQPATCHLTPNEVSRVLSWDFGETGLRPEMTFRLMFYFSGSFWLSKINIRCWVTIFFYMIWISLGQETCHTFSWKDSFGACPPVCETIEEKTVYAPPEGLWSVSLSAGSTGSITFSSPRMVHEQVMQNSVFPNSAFGWWAELSSAPEAGRQVTWMAQELSRGKVSPCLEACYRMVSGFTGEEGSPICLGSAHACKVALPQICIHLTWMCGNDCRRAMWSQNSTLSAHAIVSSGSTCPCSLVLL